MRKHIADVKEAFLELLFPKRVVCGLCGCEIWPESKYGLCGSCRDLIEWNTGRTCCICGIGIPNAGESRCHTCLTRRFTFDSGMSVFVYDEVSKPLIMNFKYNQQTHMKYMLSEMLIEWISASLGWSYDFIVPVPMHESRLKIRGYNQTALLAEEISNYSGIPVFRGLERVSKTPRLKRLDAGERKTVLQNVLHVSTDTPLHAKRFLLIDDIITTGSTLNACAEVLKTAGGLAVDCAVIAANPLDR